MEVRVTDRWIEDERRAQAALKHLDSLMAHVALCQLLERTRKLKPDGHAPPHPLAATEMGWT